MPVRQSFMAIIRFVLIISIVIAATSQTGLAERPAATKLLPKKTLVCVRVVDAPELAEKFQKTSLGKIGQDEKIRPLIGQLYGSVVEAFGQIQDEVGVPLGKLLALPQGELCVAVVAPESGRPAVVILADVGDQMPTARTLLDRAETLLKDTGAVRSKETVAGTELTIYKDANREERHVVQFEKDGTIGITSNLDVAKQILGRWKGDKNKDDDLLADNRKYTTIMNRCRGTKDERPQFTWFVDPIEFAKTAARGNFAAQTGLAILPSLGLDGLQAVGGSMILAAEEFDSIGHVHVMLDNPRAGIIKMLALGSGDITPEPWVPTDAAGYMTMHWDADTTYSTLATLFDSFRGEGELSRAVKRRISDRLEIDFEKEILGQLDGRVTLVTWIEPPPAKLNSQAMLLAIKLKDAVAVKKIVEKFISKYPDRVENKMLGGVSYYQVKGRDRRRPQGEERGGDLRRQLRRPQPCVAIVGDYLMATGSTKLLERAIITKSDASHALANEPDFKLIASKVKRQAGPNRPGMIAFERPEKGFRLLYDLAKSPDTRKLLSDSAVENKFFKAIHNALEDNPLPPFADLAKYLAPAGGVLTNDETGFHYTAFALKREASE